MSSQVKILNQKLCSYFNTIGLLSIQIEKYETVIRSLLVRQVYFFRQLSHFLIPNVINLDKRKKWAEIHHALLSQFSFLAKFFIYKWQSISIRLSVFFNLGELHPKLKKKDVDEDDL